MTRFTACVLLALVGCGGSGSPAAPTAPAAKAAPAIPAGSAPGASEQSSAAAAGAEVHDMPFADVTRESGLDATMTSGKLPSTQILEVKGGGLALFDADNDGDLDLFMPNGATLDDPEHGPGARLFENVTKSHGAITFRDVTASSGIDHHRWSFGVACGDVDGDLRDDLYICCFGPDVLLRNVSAAGAPPRFEDITAKAGLGAAAGDNHWTTSAAFGDLDGDGDLDLYTTNYLAFDPAKPPGPTIFKNIPVMSGPVGLPAAPDVLYENLGNGTFRDVSEASGIRAVEPAFGLNVAILDFTGDGKADIFVGNDSQVNNLFVNTGTRGEGSTTALEFEDIGLRSGIGTNMEGLAQATMGVAIADVDGNGRPDVYTTAFSSDTDTLHLNRDGRTFDDRTQQYGLAAVTRQPLGWACGFFDFDHDADEDLFIVNGHVYPQATRQSMDSAYEQTPLLFARSGKRFERMDAQDAGPWIDEPHRDRTAVFGDLDGDGDIDIVIGELNGPLRVMRNGETGHAGASSTGSMGWSGPGPRNWLIVELNDTSAPGNRHGVGAMVECRRGDLIQRRWIYGGGPFQSTIVPMAHFGLERPPHSHSPLMVSVTWPDGVRTVHELELDERHVIKR